jgi:hypothetical protein
MCYYLIMNRLNIASEVVVIGGFSEGSDLLDPTRRALSEGPGALFSSAVDFSPNIADVIADPDGTAKVIEGKTVYMRSLASLLTSDEYAEWRSKAHGFITDVPVEPVGIMGIANGARKVAWQKQNNEENPDHIPGFMQGPNELRRHKKINLRLPFVAAKFSTVAAIAGAPSGSFNGGLGYFEREDDEFDFQNVHGNAVDFMRTLSYDAARLPGKHMGGVYQAEAFAMQLKKYLEVTN